MGMWIGRGRKARMAYGFDDIALVPGAVTVNPNEVDLAWELCGQRFEIPIIAAAMDGVVGPRLAAEMGRHGGLAVLNLEGIQTRYKDPDQVIERIVSASLDEATRIIQGIYGEPIKEELIHKRISEIKKGGGPAVVSSIPQRAERFAKIAEEAGADIFVVQSTVTTARHIATEYMPVDLRESFDSVLSRMRAAKAGVEKRQADLLAERYDLANRPLAGAKMTKGKAVQGGARARLPQGTTFDQLAGMSPADIRAIVQDELLPRYAEANAKILGPAGKRPFLDFCDALRRAYLPQA